MDENNRTVLEDTDIEAICNHEGLSHNGLIMIFYLRFHCTKP